MFIPCAMECHGFSMEKTSTVWEIYSNYCLSNEGFITGWWFGTFCIFPYIGNNNPNWRTPSFFRGIAKNHQPLDRQELPITVWSNERICIFLRFLVFLQWVSLDSLDHRWSTKSANRRVRVQSVAVPASVDGDHFIPNFWCCTLWNPLVFG